MTKVDKIYEREKEEAVNAVRHEAERREVALRMLLKGDTIINITKETGFTEEEIQDLIK